MSEPSEAARAPDPDPDLLEYVLFSASSVEALTAVAAAVGEVVRTGSIRLVHAVVLSRREGRTTVQVTAPGEHAALVGLGSVADSPLALSAHDVELAALTVGPGQAALLLLVEDRWAGALSVAARKGGGRVAAGERIARERVLASLDRGRAPEDLSGRADLLVRGPGTVPVVDRVEQVHELARLVDRGLLSLERYEVQRRRALDG